MKDPKNGLDGYQLTLTGHSLGGGLGEYAGVMNDVAVVSYEAPNVIASLPKDKKEKALREIIKINYNYRKPQ